LTSKVSPLFWLIMLTMWVSMSSCVDNKGSGGRKSTNQLGGEVAPTKNEPTPPEFSTNLNFLQNGSFQSTSTLNLSVNFSDSFYLRGKSIDQFIRSGNTALVQCVVAPFPSSTDKKVLVFSATPRYFINFTDETREYYYLLTPADASSNQAQCQKTGLINQISVELATSAIAYQIRDICPGCFESFFSSQSLMLRDPSGAPTSNININNLSLRITNTGADNLPDNATCTTSSECVARGFDCCSSNQCVRDKQIKSSTNQASVEFNQALLDIQQNGANILNYSHFFHLCTQSQPDVDPEDDPVNSEEEERLRFLRLQELYSCTTPIQGEMSICTLTFENASEIEPKLYFTDKDDRNFRSTYTGTMPPQAHSIQKITYAGEILFEVGKIAPNGVEIGLNNSFIGNDNLDDPLQVLITKNALPSAPDDTLKISYQIDGSCERISQSLARCQKQYVQGQNLGHINDHFPASNQFLLPYYADINRTIRVEVDGTPKLNGSQWQVVSTSPPYIEFLGTGLQVFDTQTVIITFFVDTNAHKVLEQKQKSIDQIKNICQCASDDCALRPVKNASDVTIDYACVYPQPDLPPPPLQQTVLLSSKSAPHRFYDQIGVYQREVQIDTPPQEGTAFSYTNNDPLRPNNVDQYVGFNEIYGSFGLQVGMAKPALEVRVEKGKNYDLFVDSGSFSSCLVCGNDYYSTLRKLFPTTLGNPGSGFEPNTTDTDRTKVTDLRADDLIFGRACFVPATMIPWSHAPVSDTQIQRQRRLQTQHFAYANGYRRDWFGFDYGSLIGSFDGVKWFSVGSQRRVRAETNKLFLAINAYHSDLTQESTFKVVVSDASNIPSSGSTITNDFDSDGAQCQRMHTCNTDRDCLTQLGYEYSCQSISNLSSPWPIFDVNANEIPNGSSMERLQSLLSANQGGVRRCVYRGRGASCRPSLELTSTTNTFNLTTSPGSLGCSSNNYCQVFSDGNPVNRFNDRSARFGRSVANQNASPTVPESNLDTFGQGARIIGRPFKYNGERPIPTEVLSNMNVNSIRAMCIPGRNPQSTTLNSQNSSAPSVGFEGDKVLGLGVSASGVISPRYLSACSVLDENNNYYHLNLAKIMDVNDSQTIDPEFQVLAGTQATTTNALKIFEAMLGDRLTENFEAEQILQYTIEENRCLRAPGAACHTDQDCAPNKKITDLLSSIDPTDEGLHSFLNMYELFFWKETLVCSQDKAKTDPDYQLKNNRCCRETGQILNIGTFVDQAGYVTQLSSTEAPRFNQESIPGIDIELNNPRRLTRLAPVRRDMQQNPARFPALESVRADYCLFGTGSCRNISELQNQFNTLDNVAKRTCCSGHWIRHWDKDDNGGGHRWSPQKLQTVNKTNFRCLNWIQKPAGHPSEFTCNSAEFPDDPDCFSRSITPFQAEPILKWLNKFELLGVPQVAIESNDLLPALDCSVDPSDHATAGGGIIIPGFVNNAAVREYIDDTNNEFYAADDLSNFDADKRNIFSKDQFSCCLPAGTEVPQGTNRDQCCTGFINGLTNRCALPDFTNVSLYLNRYISSEGAGLADNLYDAESGFIKSSSFVEQLACQKRICASGTLARGVVHSPLKVRGHENNERNFRRFLDGNDESNNFSGLATLFDEGLRWNNQVYCAPESIIEDSSEDPSIVIIRCPQ
jgi:hypothetical protein